MRGRSPMYYRWAHSRSCQPGGSLRCRGLQQGSTAQAVIAGVALWLPRCINVPSRGTASRGGLQVVPPSESVDRVAKTLHDVA
eukprot:CAMPEP_0181231338 /NCGR_PEP_ID=MMETSP1096-20121128/35044_1 /TAXON_ID=156174 ORGANISM="Chrysochromulina ericina, Strain CCMP281" /NCGR_SAMPLE_ID=MMETSP1096 /ASSEMBLY_ACC=CAM_ASM_000453 /LENGTH=82 /DNA_ID=CAMNT_0023325355 /DNA_START=110 /DNA_END=355 /DNA_ORIENTATION=-